MSLSQQQPCRHPKLSPRMSAMAFVLATAAATAFLIAITVVQQASAAEGLYYQHQRGLLQEGSTQSVPTECINTGLNLQSSCTKELELASKAFGLSPTSDVSSIKVNMSQLRAYLAKAPKPSADCCSAALSFNNAYCSCSPPVLDLVKSFTNNDVNQYYEVAKYLATRCKEVGKPFTLYLEKTCPKRH
ncbi:hypothetical protein Vafri_17101 [Volvox africanus]|uniref:Uncharacterized protein n=1 Tax=Volvox africanus TaxID=51714 RepID=A0A8J4F6A8_9CHLO|nr:hypothetical protein Vafri_17101 [Volvox africanus]